MQTIEIAATTPSEGNKWEPFMGNELQSLLDFKGFHGQTRDKVIAETFRIMQMCGNPNEDSNTDTGLVIGYVQSGKTLSFTSLTALANDNHYQIIIIIAGTSIPLSDQSHDRMRRDLRLDNRHDRKWVLLKNPSTESDRDTIQMKLDQWADDTYPDENCATVLITVMKNGRHLLNLINVMRTLNLTGSPTMIIDDEGDQASLNTRASSNSASGSVVNEGDVSTIYRRINELRNLFNHHTFLQYTATPQGNLFINIMDRLSPNFIRLLQPGDEYAGGKTFFIQNPILVRAIPSEEIPGGENHLTDPPETLLIALKVYFLGVVAGDITRDQRNRSMMVHPSRLTDSQNLYYTWIKDICESWKRILLSRDEEDKQSLLEEFLHAYNDLTDTVGPSLPSFEELTGNRLIHAINYTRIMQINARRGKTPPIQWSDCYSHILVGGQAMDRGFTVEGLTVTYMPRSLGTGQVDTTLQRARFFGYKGSYLGFCRVWLDEPSIDAYKAIIEHEEDVRKRLEDFDVNNKHLNQWDREVVLDEILNLTRPNILFDNINRDYFGEEWFTIKAPHDTDTLIIRNKEQIERFINEHNAIFQTDIGHAHRTEEQKHLVARLPLRVCLSALLNRLKFTRESDSQTFSSLRGILASYLYEHPTEECLIYLMSARKDNGEILQSTRSRRLHENNTNTIRQLFQGKNPKTGEVVYPGDREIKTEDQLTIQIHRLHLKDQEGNNIYDQEQNLLYNDVYTIAIWIPADIGQDVIRQS